MQYKYSSIIGHDRGHIEVILKFCECVCVYGLVELTTNSRDSDPKKWHSEDQKSASVSEEVPPCASRVQWHYNHDKGRELARSRVSSQFWTILCVCIHSIGGLGQ